MRIRRRTLPAVAVAVAIALAVLAVRQLWHPGSASAGLGTGGDRGALFPTAFHALPTKPVTGPNVVLICIDTLRADHLGTYGYSRPTSPRIDRFAAGCRVFDRAYATAPFTGPSVVSMLTGLYPNRHGVRLLWQKVEARTITVADHLRRAGYTTAAIVSNLVLSHEACGLGVRFDHYDDAVDEPEPHRPHMLERRAARTTDAAITWLETAIPEGEPFFLWVHYIDPHGPYRPPAEAPRRFDHEAPEPIEWERIAPYVREPGVTDAMEYVDRYDEEIAYTDQEVGRLLDALDEMGIAEDALVILTSDHGETLQHGDPPYFAHGFGVRENVLHVPLLVRHESLEPQRVDQPVSIADVAPTVLDVVGLPIPAGLDGRSLTGAISARPPYAEGPDPAGSGGLHRAFVYPRRKVVVPHGRSNEPGEAWAFDVLADPGEDHTLPVDADEPAYRVLVDLIRAETDPGGRPRTFLAGNKPNPLVADDVDPEVSSKLRGLGYVN